MNGQTFLNTDISSVSSIKKPTSSPAKSVDDDSIDTTKSAFKDSMREVDNRRDKDDAGKDNTGKDSTATDRDRSDAAVNHTKTNSHEEGNHHSKAKGKEPPESTPQAIGVQNFDGAESTTILESVGSPALILQASSQIPTDSQITTDLPRVSAFSTTDAELHSVESTEILSPNITESDVVISDTTVPDEAVVPYIATMGQSNLSTTPLVKKLAATELSATTPAKVTELAKAAGLQIPSASKIVEKIALDNVALDNAVTTQSPFTLSSSLTENIASVGQFTLQEASHLSDAVATVNNAMISTPASPVTTGSPLLISTPVQQPQWGEAVAEKVMWMSAKGIKSAEIQLDPPELGPLSVKVSVNQEQAQVSFTAQHASVREALDQSVLRLREMFAEEGIDLADVDVSDQSQSEQNESEEAQDSQDGLIDSDDETVVESETALSSQANNYNLIDSYA